MKTIRQPPHKARVYWQKAQRFARAARMDLEAGEDDPAMSCAVNAVINLVDALCVHYAGERSASDNHGDSIRLLRSVDGIDPSTRDAIGKRLSALLSVKSLAQYDGELATKKDAADAVKEMERALSAAGEIARTHRWE